MYRASKRSFSEETVDEAANRETTGVWLLRSLSGLDITMTSNLHNPLVNYWTLPHSISSEIHILDCQPALARAQGQLYYPIKCMP